MCRVQIINDKNTWNKVIEGFAEKDIYFTYDYFIPFKNNGDGEPILFLLDCEYGKVAYPFMLRDIAKSENFIGVLEENTYLDISSAYGYGGPLFESYGTSEGLTRLQKAFFDAFLDYCINSNIVSQFDRFHPLLKNYRFFENYVELLPIRKTVHMDLENQDNIWHNIDSKCRNMVRKAQKNEITIILEDCIKTIEEFKDIYRSTMMHNNAADYYYFNNNFFNETVDSLDKNLFIANAYCQDKIIASSLILRYDKYLHYHFSGALNEYRNLQANNLLLYEVANWGNKNGYKIFHLGGGYRNESDSLYKFKKSFSRLEDDIFYIGKKIYNLDKYKYLESILYKSTTPDGSFFPSYRGK